MSQYSDKMQQKKDEGDSSRVKVCHSIKGQEDEERSSLTKFADKLTEWFGTSAFLIGNVVFFVIWILLNTGVLGFKPFDEYPFNFLTMVVSLEAIVLSIIVLISQNRQAKTAELREEIDLQINILAEKENQKMMELLVMLLEKQGIDLSKDEDLQDMLKGDSEQLLEEQLRAELKDK